MNFLSIILLVIAVFILVVVGILYFIKEQEKLKIRAIVFYPDRKMRVFKVKPDNQIIYIEEKAYDINDKDFIISKGLVTYIFNYNNTVPLNPYTAQITEYLPEEYNSAMKSKIVSEIVASSSGKNKFEMNTLNLLISLGTVAVVGIVAYLGYQLLGDLQDKVDIIIEGLKSIGIGGIE